MYPKKKVMNTTNDEAKRLRGVANKRAKGNWTEGDIDHRWATSLIGVKVLDKHGGETKCTKGEVVAFVRPAHFNVCFGDNIYMSLPYNDLKRIIDQNQDGLELLNLPDTPPRVLKLEYLEIP